MLAGCRRRRSTNEKRHRKSKTARIIKELNKGVYGELELSKEQVQKIYEEVPTIVIELKQKDISHCKNLYEVYKLS